MALPLSFESVSARYQLPLLFAGQAQKEIIINEALARIDSLLHASAAGVLDDPPATPAAGETWIIGANASGPWAGKADVIATYSAGDWLYCAPIPGMRCYVQSSGAFATFNGSWEIPQALAPVSGGTTVDSEARVAIENLVSALKATGILAP